MNSNQTGFKQRMADLAATPHARGWLSFFSFSDSSFSPLPPDPLLAAMCYLQPYEWKRFALITTVASIVGAIFGYILGLLFSVEIVNIFTNYLHLGQALNDASELYHQHASLALLIAAFTPIPFKVFTVSAGIFGINFILFVVISIIGRAARLVIVSYIAARFGSYGLQRFKTILLIATLILIVAIIMWLFR